MRNRQDGRKKQQDQRKCSAQVETGWFCRRKEKQNHWRSGPLPSVPGLPEPHELAGGRGPGPGGQGRRRPAVEPRALLGPQGWFRGAQIQPGSQIRPGAHAAVVAAFSTGGLRSTGRVVCKVCPKVSRSASGPGTASVALAASRARPALLGRPGGARPAPPGMLRGWIHSQM